MGPLEPDFTADQATDLARYFLGRRWFASPIGDQMTLSDGEDLFVGATWREVFRAAGVHLPARSRYTAHGTSVMMEDRPICTAVSNTLAKRIAAALNNHTPDRRGI